MGKNIVLSVNTQDLYAIELLNAQEVNGELLDLYQKLNQNWVNLGSCDVPFLVIDKETKKGKIILGDLANVRFVEREKFPQESIEEYNLRELKTFAKLINDKFLVNGELEVLK